MLVKLELVGKWKNEDAVFLVKGEKDLKSEEAVTKIHKVLNHKKKEQMLFVKNTNWICFKYSLLLSNDLL